MRYSRLLPILSLVVVSAVSFAQAPVPKGEKDGGSEPKTKQKMNDVGFE